MYVTILEWDDGTVAVNGPYETGAAAEVGAVKLAEHLARESGRVATVTEDGAVVHDGNVPADEDDNRLDIYVREAGSPWS